MSRLNRSSFARRAMPLALLLPLFAGCGGGEGEGSSAPDPAVSAALERGNSLARAGQHQRALEEYQSVGETDDVRVQLAMGRSLFAMVQYQQARAVLSAAALAHPDNAEVALNLGVVHMKTLNLELAARELRRATELDSDSHQAHLYLGRAIFERSLLFSAGDVNIDQERLGEAIVAIERAVEIDPANAESRFMAARAYFRSEDRDKAITHLQELVRVTPGHMLGHQMLGKLLVDRGDIEPGRQALEAALKLGPEVAENHFEYGVVFEEMGETDKAMLAYGRALELRPSLKDAHFRMATLLRREGKDAEADLAQKAFELWDAKERDLTSKQLAAMAAPDDGLKQYEFGLALLELQREQEAITSFYRALELSPNLAGAYNALGRIAERDGKLVQARDFFERVTTLTAEVDGGPLGLPELLRVTFKQNDFPAAELVCLQLIEKYPSDPEYRVRLSNILLRAGDLEGAGAEVVSALELDPDNVEALYWQGTIALFSQDGATAEASWNRVLELQPDHEQARVALEGLPEALEQLKKQAQASSGGQ